MLAILSRMIVEPIQNIFFFLEKKKDFVGLLCFVFSCVSPSAPSTEFAATENCMCLREKS